MKSQSETYRERAKAAEENAEKARDPDVRASWHKVAEDWSDMADQAKRMGR